MSTPPQYAELHCKTNFSFLCGASHPEELVTQAAALGQYALAITDQNSLAGVVRAHAAAKNLAKESTPFKLLIGAEITPADAAPVLLYASNLAGYRHLSSLITRGRRAAEKGECRLVIQDVADYAGDLIAAVVVGHPAADAARLAVLRYREIFGERCYLAAAVHRGANDEARLARCARLAKESRLPLLATNDIHYHEPGRRALHDVLTAIRHGITVAELGTLRFPNGERHLKTPVQMAELFAGHPEALAHTIELAERCEFSLDELRYEYPEELCPAGTTPSQYLSELTWAGARERYPEGVPEKVTSLLRRELALIDELHYEAFFLTCWDLVKFARGRGILCQGRGSAANSAVCYCLGITSVDPDRTDLLFERFISRERNEAPDIDVDFEHERREEVLQYIYQKYGRDRAGIVAEVITYRPRSAVRDVGKALGLSLDAVDRLAKTFDPYSDESAIAEQIHEAGLDPHSTLAVQFVKLATELLGFPRHLSQHVGGFVITRGPLSELVPIENAAMPERTVIEWDKDDLDTLGILKVDCLSLGMLTAIRKCFDLIGQHYGVALTLATIPAEDSDVYDMICKADTIGVFQIESRAQMSMLPRLRPREFYDLVIEVALVRPGPIQGGMVHPYLRRRAGQEPVVYPNPVVEEVLHKTLGVPLFQEQVMRLAVVAAGFTPGEADQLRRAMGAWRKQGLIERFRQKLRDGMMARGLPASFADQLYEQIKGFGEYGFPEAHAASFALLAYVSAWLKYHYPAAFAAALLNSQPMGFYAPAQIVRDAKEHGVPVRVIDVNASSWDCMLEGKSQGSGVRGQGSEVKGQGRNTVIDVAFYESANCPPLPPPAETESRAAKRSAGEEGPGVRGVSHNQRDESAIAAVQVIPPHPYPSPPADNCSANVGSRQAGGEGKDRPHILSERLRSNRLPSSDESPTSDSRPLTPDSCLLTPDSRPLTPDLALRLGFRLIRGLPESVGLAIQEARKRGPFRSVADLARRAQVSRPILARLAAADALGSLGLNRRTALWKVLSLGEDLPLFIGLEEEQEMLPALEEMSLHQHVLADYETIGLSLKAHPISLVRQEMDRLEVVSAKRLLEIPDKANVRVGGLVLVRQLPSTSKGTVFMTIEDETGTVNLVLWPRIWDRFRRVIVGAAALVVDGKVERASGVQHVIAASLEDLSQSLRGLYTRSRDFH